MSVISERFLYAPLNLEEKCKGVIFQTTRSLVSEYHYPAHEVRQAIMNISGGILDLPQTGELKAGEGCQREIWYSVLSLCLDGPYPLTMVKEALLEAYDDLKNREILQSKLVEQPMPRQPPRSLPWFKSSK